MEERHEELAALNALGMLESDEKRVLTGAALADRELRELSAELECMAAELGTLIAPSEPPADMKRRIRAKIRSTGGPRWRSISAGAVIAAIGWVAAVVLALATAWLWQDRQKLAGQLAAVSRVIAPSAAPMVDDGKARTLEDELKRLRSDFEAKKAALAHEIESLKKSESEAAAKVAKMVSEAEAQKQREAGLKMQIIPIQSQVWEYRRSSMTVIWDGSRHQGVLLLEKMPRAESGKDYQLWVVDPKKAGPVSAGVVAVDEKGVAKINFKPVEDVGGDVKFALSVETKGGASKNEGPIVLTGP